MQEDRDILREGQLVRWDQKRGFGFIRPNDGGKDVFAHITSFAGQRAPQIGSQWVFSAATDPNGRGLRVIKAVPATGQARRDAADKAKTPHDQGKQRRTARPSSTSRGSRPTSKEPQPRSKHARGRRDQTLLPLRLDWRTRLIAGATLFCLVAATTTFNTTGWAWAAYPIMSLLAYFMYARDKMVAIQGGWRIPESSLHLAELLGGWPGAYVAQQTMRHKTIKTSYQMTYWAIVCLHVAAWSLWMVHPRLLADMLGNMLGR